MVRNYVDTQAGENMEKEISQSEFNELAKKRGEKRASQSFAKSLGPNGPFAAPDDAEKRNADHIRLSKNIGLKMMMGA